LLSQVDTAAPSQTLNFVLGRDSGGHWIVLEMRGLYGGIFTTKDAAVRYAKFESADRGGILLITPEPIELKFPS
jgi:hypothetical protein